MRPSKEILSNDSLLKGAYDRYSPFKGGTVTASLRDLAVTRRFRLENPIVHGLQTYLDYGIGGIGFVFKDERIEAAATRFFIYAGKCFGTDHDHATVSIENTLDLYPRFKQEETKKAKAYLEDFLVDNKLLPSEYASKLWSNPGTEMFPKHLEQVRKFGNVLLEFFLNSEYGSHSAFKRNYAEWIEKVLKAAMPQQQSKIPAVRPVSEEKAKESLPLPEQVMSIAIQQVKETRQEIVLVLKPVVEGNDVKVSVVLHQPYSFPSEMRTLRPDGPLDWKGKKVHETEIPFPSPLTKEVEKEEEEFFVKFSSKKPPDIFEGSFDAKMRPAYDKVLDYCKDPFG